MKPKSAISQKGSRQLGLLDEFIIERSKDYLAPERKGTPRGEKIGFPQKKFEACLAVALTNQSLKEISTGLGRELDFSYGLLRKWNSEADFQKERDLFRKEFVERIIAYLAREHEKSWDEDLAPVDVEKLKLNAHTFNKTILKELDRLTARDYSKYYKDILRNGVTNKNVVGGLVFADIQNLIKYARGEEISYTIADVVVNKQAISYLIDLLSKKKNLTTEEQGLVLSTLKSIDSLIDDLLEV